MFTVLKNLQLIQKKTALKRAIHKTAEATGDLISNKIADKITNTSKHKQKSKEFHSNEDNNKIPKERYIYLHKKDNKLMMI